MWSRAAATQAAGHEVDVAALQPRRPRMLGWLASVSQLGSPSRRVETSTLMKVADVPMSSFEHVWSGFGGGAVAPTGLTSPPEFHSVRRPGWCVGGRSQVIMFDACPAGATGRGTSADLVTGDLAGILLFARQDSSPAPTGG